MKTTLVLFTSLAVAALAGVNDVVSWENNDLALHGHEKNYTYKLEKDAYKFVKEVTKWTTKIVGKDKAENLKVHYNLNIKNQDISSQEKPCGDLILHRIFKAVQVIIDDPAAATYTLQLARSLAWHPSSHCLHKHNFDLIDGGAGAGFEMTCGESVLLAAGGGGAGFMKTGHEKSDDLFIGGSALNVKMLDGQLEVSGGVTGPWKAGLVKYIVPDDTKAFLKTLHHTIEDCAANNTLVVRGGGGGGWKERYMNEHSFNTDVVGYGFGFTIDFEVPETPVPVTIAPSPITVAPVPLPGSTPVPTMNVPSPTTVTPVPSTEAPAPATAYPSTDAPTAVPTPATLVSTPQATEAPAPAPAYPSTDAPTAVPTPVTPVPTPQATEAPAPASAYPSTDAPTAVPTPATPVPTPQATEAPSVVAPTPAKSMYVPVPAPIATPEATAARKLTEEDETREMVEGADSSREFYHDASEGLKNASREVRDDFMDASSTCINSSDACVAQNLFNEVSVKAFIPKLSLNTMLTERKTDQHSSVVSFVTMGCMVVIAAAFVVKTAQRRRGYVHLPLSDRS